MCYRYKQGSPKNLISKRFNIDLFDLGIVTTEEMNGFAHPNAPIIIDREPNRLKMERWGLLPSFVKDPGTFKTNTLNAKIETLEETVYKNSVDNRCLVIASEFYEWKHVGKEKIKHRIWTADGDPFAFAGIYQPFYDSEEDKTIYTFTILTTEANELMADIHNSAKRMPVVLQKEEENLWLAGEPTEIYKNRKEVQLIAEPLEPLPLQLF
jgi:putative SOS response-associated peptidase YedK